MLIGEAARIGARRESGIFLKSTYFTTLLIFCLIISNYPQGFLSYVLEQYPPPFALGACEAPAYPYAPLAFAG